MVIVQAYTTKPAASARPAREKTDLPLESRSSVLTLRQLAAALHSGAELDMITSCELLGDASEATHMRMEFSMRKARMERAAKARVVLLKRESCWMALDVPSVAYSPLLPTSAMPFMLALYTGARAT